MARHFFDSLKDGTRRLFLLSSVAHGLYLVLVYLVEVYAHKGYGAKLRYGEGIPYGGQAEGTGEYEGHWQKYHKLAKGGGKEGKPAVAYCLKQG